MRYQRIGGDDLALDLAEVREWCRADGTAEDQLIAACLRFAQALAENEADLPLPRGTFRQVVALGATSFTIPNPPLISIDMVYDSSGGELTGWTVDESGPLPCVELPVGAAEIRWSAGWTATPPHHVAGALKQLTDTFLRFPGAMTESRVDALPLGAKYILDSLRRYRPL